MTSVDECKSCPRGHWCSQGVKVPCASGTYNAFEGGERLSSCEPCPDESDSEAESTSLSQCLCRENHYANWLDGNLVCESCPARSASERASTSISQCKCDEGYFAPATGDARCESCPVGADCSQAGVQLASLPLLEGFWRSNPNTTDVRRCLGLHNGSRCVGCSGDACALGPNSTCKPGMHGPMCALCVSDTDDYYDADADECLPCASSEADGVRRPQPNPTQNDRAS